MLLEQVIHNQEQSFTFPIILLLRLSNRKVETSADTLHGVNNGEHCAMFPQEVEKPDK